MKKIKLLMFGLLSVLTLGLFVATGVNVTAASPDYNSDKTTATFTSSGYDGLKTVAYSNNSYVAANITDCASFPNAIQNKVVFIPIPSDGLGSLSIKCGSKQESRKAYILNSDGTMDSTKEFSMLKTDVSADFTSSHYITISEEKYIAVASTADFKPSSYKITLTTGAYGSGSQEEETSKTFTLKYNLNGGTSDAIADATYTDSEAPLDESHEFTVTSTVPTRSNFTFSGWSTTSTGSATYKAGDSIEVTSTTTLYAVWEKIITPIADDYLFYLTSNALPNDSRFDFSDCSTSNSKGSVTYDDITSSNCIKMESKTTIVFKLNKVMKVSFVFVENASLTIDGTAYSSSTSNVYTTILSSGNHSITKNGAVNLFFINFENPMSDNVTATTSAWQNSDKDALRFVGTISGVSDLSTIDTIELVLLKNDVATSKKIFLTTCYISVSGAGSFGKVDDTYYVVYRITNITSTAMPDNTVIKHKLIVTFTDGSSVTSTVVSSTWKN